MMSTFLLPLFIYFLIVLVSSQNTDELVTVLVIYRNGDRTLLETYPNDPYKDLKQDELTMVEKQHQYEQEKWLRMHYADFLSEQYTRKDNLLQQPIPIHTNNCLKMYLLLAELYLSDYAQNIDRKNAQLYQYLTNNTGEFFGTFLQIQSLRNVLYTESKLNLELPDWTKSVYPEKLDELAATVFSLFANNTELSKFSTGIFFNDVLEIFENPSKFNVYSAHASNIASIVYTLEPSHDKFCPEFASMVIFELWKKDGENVVQAFLKDTDMVVPIYIENCGDDCELEKFGKVLKYVAVTEEQWRTDCFTIV